LVIRSRASISATSAEVTMPAVRSRMVATASAGTVPSSDHASTARISISSMVEKRASSLHSEAISGSE
jgi:hypothetical protein